MKALILTFAIALSSLAFAKSVCVDVNDAGWSENQYQAYPDGSIVIKDPFYKFNNESYLVSYDTSSLSGICRAFGRKLVRSNGVYFGESKVLVSLNEEGEIIDATNGYNVTTYVQCK